MDVLSLRQFFEVAINEINTLTGLAVPLSAAGGIALACIIAGAALAAFMNGKKLRMTIIRLFSNKPVLDEDGEAVVATVRSDLDGVERTIQEGSRKTIEQIKVGLSDLEREIRNAASSQHDIEVKSLLKVLATRVEQSSELMKESDTADGASDKADVTLDRHGRVRRAQMVRLLRETVLSNLWSGNYFTENRRRRFVFQTTFLDRDKNLISVIVRTPFAEPEPDADQYENRYPYEISVRQSNETNSKTLLRMYWDPIQPDDINVRYASRGAWEQAIISWNVTQEFIPLVRDDEKVVSLETAALA